MISLKDIAAQLGVSASTVSRAVNGKKYINPEKRARILKLIEETGYVPNQAARNMVLRRSFTVGIIIPDTFNMFQRQLFSIIERCLNSFGYHSLFFFVKFDGTSEKECLDRMKSEKPDGIIMLHEILGDTFYDYAARIRLPLVSAAMSREGISSVHVDEERAAFEGVTHLLNLGHRKIVMITGSGFTFGSQRMEGYFKALEAAGIARDSGRVVSVGYYTAEFGMYGMRELRLRDRDFTAVFTATDELAIGAMRVLRDEGLRVPGDVSVVGFDDIEISNYFIPRLTTIHQPIIEIGEQAALSLHRRINGDNSSSEILIPHKLIIRESTRAGNKRPSGTIGD
jgi:LacI family transcriptional regulator